MNGKTFSLAIAKEQQMLGSVVQKTSLFLGYPPTGAVDARLTYRRKCWGEVGAFFGGMCGIFCGFVLSFTSSLGSMPLTEIGACWLFLCLAGAVAMGGAAAFFAGAIKIEK